MLNNVNKDKSQSEETKKSLIELYTNIQLLQKKISIKLSKIEGEK